MLAVSKKMLRKANPETVAVTVIVELAIRITLTAPVTSACPDAEDVALLRTVVVTLATTLVPIIPSVAEFATESPSPVTAESTFTKLLLASDKILTDPETVAVSDMEEELSETTPPPASPTVAEPVIALSAAFKTRTSSTSVTVALVALASLYVALG